MISDDNELFTHSSAPDNRTAVCPYKGKEKRRGEKRRKEKKRREERRELFTLYFSAEMQSLFYVS